MLNLKLFRYFFPLHLHTDDPRKNIWPKLKNRAKLEKSRKLCCLLFRNFLSLLPESYFWREDWGLGCVPTQI